MELDFEKKIIDAIVKRGFAGMDEIKRFTAYDNKSSYKRNLIKTMIDSSLVPEWEFVAILAEELDIPAIDLARIKVDEKTIQIIPEKMAKQYNVAAVSLLGNVLTIVLSDPTDIFVIDDVKSVTGYEINIAVSSKRAIGNFLNTKSNAEIVVEKPAENEEYMDSGDVEIVERCEDKQSGDTLESSNTAPIVKMVTVIIKEAIKRRASDIHIEPMEKSLQVRYRIDGGLVSVFDLPKKNQNALIARIKIMSNLDITETRLPQDGRFRIKIEEREVDFRVSVLPTIWGNKIVLRVLDKNSLSIGLESLGFLPETLSIFNTAMEKPYGIILVTGPTGSGKSTTLYSILNKLNIPERNIVTVEDPVEYQLLGITQTAVRQEIGLTFASGLRSLLRQSPDIILIGEIRDQETADIAIKSALTGHKVLSTLHTNDSVGSITRLVNMGIEPFLIASSLILSTAQRLLKKICPHCKVKADIDKKVIDDLESKYPEIKTAQNFSKGKGCVRCGNTGYLGRLAVMEALLIDTEIKDMIAFKVEEEEIKAYLKKKGFKTLRDNAVITCANGFTTIEEVFRAT
ncbi:type II secretion system protein E (GspE) [Candidatus Omnitrophus magneticus]|uniref:Type II secretion system protein E (GspE) n=1 Tax=Candidatus Omnitrophus magneticus TaxID=1609969 RepID=A0A0F0CUA0_9BACT|nr:type II secretion system protein E (GspE) [Candidatus Omnitrophus magneticus]